MDCGLKFWREDKTVRIQLPSGRIQNYPRSSNRKGQLRWQYGKLYGGLLVENITQACSRDIFVEGLLQCWKEGLRPVMHIHDKLISCVKEDEAEDQQKKMQEIMTINPTWCPGLPLEVEGKISKNYE
jgi:DNA polymerase